MPLIRIIKAMPGFTNPAWAMQGMVGCEIDYRPEKTAAILSEYPDQAKPGGTFIAIEVPAFLDGLRQLDHPMVLDHWERKLAQCRLFYLLASCYEEVSHNPEGT